MNGRCHGNPLRGGCRDKGGDLVSPTGVQVGGVTGSIHIPPPTLMANTPLQDGTKMTRGGQRVSFNQIKRKLSDQETKIQEPF